MEIAPIGYIIITSNSFFPMAVGSRVEVQGQSFEVIAQSANEFEVRLPSRRVRWRWRFEAVRARATMMWRRARYG